jgi:PIN domain nuclease of toxin-antitoxin system
VSEAVLDSSALLVLLFDEPGAERVAALAIELGANAYTADQAWTRAGVPGVVLIR